MSAITVTINTPASGPFQLSQLFGLRTNSYGAAVTVTGATGGAVYPHAPKKPNFLTIQSDPVNAGNFAYWGDKNLTPTVAGNVDRKLAAGVIDEVETQVSLDEVYINGSAATVIINVVALGGSV